MSDEPRPSRKNRSALQKFYGTDAGQKKNRTDELSLDSGSFNPEKYVKKLLKDQTLSGLMTKDVELANQIKSLDSELQMMVYENYSKFITATDTIKKMKSHVMSMEDEMKNLSKNMEEITSCANTINKNLGEKREKIDNLASVNRMLKKMQLLLELPARLNQCVEAGTYRVGIDYYTKASKILTQYNHLPSFKAIQQESLEVINKIRVILKKMITRPNAQPKDIEENLQNLLRINEPVESLRKEYLDNRKEKLKFVLASFKVDLSTGFKSNLVAINLAFLPLYLEALRIYNSVFLGPLASNQSTAEKDLNTFIEWTREIFSLYFPTIRKLLIESYKPSGLSKDEVEKEAELDKSARDLRDALLQLSTDMSAIHGKVPGANLQDKLVSFLSETVGNYLEQNINYVKDSVQKEFLDLAKLTFKKNKSNEENYKAVIDKLVQNFLNGIDHVIKQYKLFIDTDNPNLQYKMQLYKSWIKAYSVTLFEWLTTCLEGYTSYERFSIYEKEKKPETTPSGCLVFAKFCIQVKKKVVGVVSQMLEERFPSQQSRAKSMFDPEIVEEMLNTVSKKLILYYIESQGQQLSKLVYAGIKTANWMNAGVPHTVRDMITTIVADVLNMNSELAELFKDMSKSDPSDSNSSSYLLNQNPYKKQSGLDIYEQASISKNVMKLFDKKLGTFSVVAPEDFSRASIITEIIKITIKTLEECVRTCTFNKYGYQQLQVETQFLSKMWSTLAEDETYVSTLLGEVMSSVAERCVDPTFLEQNIVDKICQTSIEQFNIKMKSQ